MPYQYKSKKSAAALFTLDKVKSFFPYLIALALGIWIVPKIYKLVLDAIAKMKIDSKEVKDKSDKATAVVDNNNAMTQQQKANSITNRKDVQSDAKALAYHLGLSIENNTSFWSWANPKNWTENDDLIVNILIRERLNYGQLKKLYYSCYTDSRNLGTDLMNLLDSDSKIRLKKAIPTFTY